MSNLNVLSSFETIYSDELNELKHEFDVTITEYESDCGVVVNRSGILITVTIGRVLDKVNYSSLSDERKQNFTLELERMFDELIDRVGDIEVLWDGVNGNLVDVELFIQFNEPESE